MNLKRALTKETILLELKNSSKEGVIEELVDLLMTTGRIRDRKAALKSVLDREKKMSTGMQNGIAIPHGKTDAVDGLIAGLALKKEGIDFGALDGQPSRIFVITLSPDTRTGPHIQFLAEISRSLNDPQTRERVLTATTTDQVVEILAG